MNLHNISWQFKTIGQNNQGFKSYNCYDKYIMMSCLSLCVSRKMITSYPPKLRRREARRPLGLDGHGIGWLWPSDQGLTSTRYPTRTFFLLLKPDPNYFSKFPSLGFFLAGYVAAGRFKSSNNNPQILLFSSRLDMKSSVSKEKCLKYKKWIQGKLG